jgi:hypothetical protein
VNGEATGQTGQMGTNDLGIVAREERRRTRRVRLELAARLKPYYQSQHLPPEIRPTTNISRDGIYFTTRRDTYGVGMHLLVSCPHTKAEGASTGDLARVVRVEARGEAWGVALKFVRSNCYHRNSAGPSSI